MRGKCSSEIDFFADPWQRQRSYLSQYFGATEGVPYTQWFCKREDFLAAAQHIIDICADGQLHADTTPM